MTWGWADGSQAKVRPFWVHRARALMATSLKQPLRSTGEVQRKVVALQARKLQKRRE